MKHLTLALITILSCYFSGICQNTNPDCTAYKTGIYYSYPKNTMDRYTCRRKGRTEIETNLDTGDSTVWEISWQNNCTYTLRYVRGSEQLKAKAQKFLDKHEMAFKVETITPDYYVYTVYVDEVSKKPYASDTMWIHEKTDFVANDHNWFIPNESYLRKRHFSDTSQYAVLYLYRPGKLKLALSTYPIYFNDTAVWIAKNKSSCIIMIRNEGSVELKSKLYKDSSSVKMDIQFGKRYYVKSMINWGLHTHGYNFKLEMAAMKPQDAKPEFEEINTQ